MQQSLTIQLVTWNNAPQLKEALSALQKIPKHIVIRVIDNASQDDTLLLVRKHLPGAEIVRLNKNYGFAGGHNIGFQSCVTKFVMFHNPDLCLHWPGVEKIMTVFADPTVASCQGLLYRSAMHRGAVIDSAGISMTLALNGMERGAGQADLGQFSSRENLAAVTGAAGIYRLKALQEVARGREILDEDFFAYKEDVDLGWRLRRQGWKNIYVPATQGVHQRSHKQVGAFGWSMQPAAFVRRLRDQRTHYSFRNWLWLMAKNASWGELAKHLPFIILRLLIFVLLTCAYPPLLRTWWQTGGGLAAMRRKGKIIKTI